MPVMSAVGMDQVRFKEDSKKGSHAELPSCLLNGGAKPSRHLRTARRARHLAGVETARADLHFRDLAVYQRANDLEIRLPRAARAVVRVRHVVAVRDTLVAVVAAIACDGHGYFSPTNSMRAMSAPSPLRNPVLRMRV